MSADLLFSDRDAQRANVSAASTTDVVASAVSAAARRSTAGASTSHNRRLPAGSKASRASTLCALTASSSRMARTSTSAAWSARSSPRTAVKPPSVRSNTTLRFARSHRSTLHRSVNADNVATNVAPSDSGAARRAIASNTSCLPTPPLRSMSVRSTAWDVNCFTASAMASFTSMSNSSMFSFTTSSNVACVIFFEPVNDAMVARRTKI